MASLRATGSRIAYRLVGLFALAVWGAPAGAAELFRDDFSGFPAGCSPAARPAERRDPGIPLPGASRGAARAVGQRDLLPRRLGRRRGGRQAVPRAAHGQRPDAAASARSSSRATPSGTITRSRSALRPLSLEDMAGRRLPLPHQPPSLPVRLDGGQRARLAVRLPLEEKFRVAELAGAGHGGVPLRHRPLLPAQGREPRGRRSAPTSTTSSILSAEDARAPPGQGGAHRQHPRPLPRLPRRRRRRRDEASHRRRGSRDREAELAGLRGREPAAEALEEVRHPEVRRRAERPLRRPRRRRQARHADRPEHRQGATATISSRSVA